MRKEFKRFHDHKRERERERERAPLLFYLEASHQSAIESGPPDNATTHRVAALRPIWRHAAANSVSDTAGDDCDPWPEACTAVTAVAALQYRCKWRRV